MQCLYCAKQLPLFKRLTKGEFCSEQHRQQYQLEYSQMALTRLLQAKPTAGLQRDEAQPPRGITANGANGAHNGAPAAVPKAPPSFAPALNAAPSAIAEARPFPGNGDYKPDSSPAVSRAATATLREPAPQASLSSARVSLPLTAARNGTSKSAQLSVTLADDPAEILTLAHSAPVEPIEAAMTRANREIARAPFIEPAPLVPEAPPFPTEAQRGTNPAPSHNSGEAPQNEAKPDVVAPAQPAGPIELRASVNKAQNVAPMRVDLEFVSAACAEKPRGSFAPPLAVVDPAPRMSHLEILGPATAQWRCRAGRLEIREFARSAPLLHLPTSIALPSVQPARQPAKTSFAPSRTRNAATLLSEPHQDFHVVQIEFREAAVLDLPTTGFETSGIYAVPEESVATSTPISAASDAGSTAHEQVRRTENIAPETVAAPVSEHTTALTETVASPITESVVGATSEPITPTIAAGAEIDAPTESAIAAQPEIELPEAALPENLVPTADAIASTEPESIAPPGDAIAAAEPAEDTVASGMQELPPAEMETSAEPRPLSDTAHLPVTAAAQSPADREPVRLTQPMPVSVVGIAAGKAKPQQIFTSTLKADVAGQIPRYETLPLRPTVVLIRADAPVTKPEPVRTETVKTDTIQPEPVKIDSGEEQFSTPIITKPEPSKTDKLQAKQSAPKNQESSPASLASEKELAELNREHARLNREQAELNRVRSEHTPREAPAHAQVILTQRTPNVALPGTELDLAEVNREQAKLNREQAELNRAQAELNREQARRNRELAKTAERIAASTVLPVIQPGQPVPLNAKPSEPKLSPPSLATAPALAETLVPMEETDLGLPKLDMEAAKGRFPLWAKIAVPGAAVLLLIAAVLFFSNHTPPKAPEIPGVISLSGGTGPEWIENFSPDPKHPRTISVLRATQAWTDYSVEFSASVETKALGWVFRAKDPANFYVGRIEQEKTRAGSSAVFVYFPVIKGVPQARKRSAVTLPVTPGKAYDVRLEAFRDRFSAWIGDRKIEEWTDSRLPSGGAGLYSEDGERAIVQGAFRVVPTDAAK